MRLTEACIRKPVMAWMLMIAVIVFGGVSLSKIGISQFPDVDFPNVSVQVTWDGASAEAVESDVIEVIEDALSSMDGIAAVSATSRTGSGTVNVEFALGKEIDGAVQEVQAKLAQITRRLPKDLDPPVVSKLNPEDFPIMFTSLSGPIPRRELSDTARTLRERLMRVPGVGDIFIGGALERSIRLWFDPRRLEEHDLAITEVIAALQRQHQELPSGTFEPQTRSGRQIDVRLKGEAADLDAFRSIVVGGTPNRPIRLSDVALVEDGFEDTKSVAKMNGKTGVALGIRKQRGVNQVDVAKAVRKEVAAINDSLKAQGDGLQLDINFDGTVFVERSIWSLAEEVALAVLLTSLVCWLFLGSFAATINVVLAIPMSLFGTIGVLYACGYTLNTFTLLALGLVVGLVVDDAIMVQENIARHQELGAKPRQAASRGTREIAFAALAATVAVIAIFVPVLFLPGVIGRFFFQFGLAFSVAVALSYVEAVTLAPARCSQLILAGERKSLLGRLVDRAWDGLTVIYQRVVGGVTRWPVATLVGAVLFFAVSVFGIAYLPRDFAPSEDQGNLRIKVDTAPGANLQETIQQMDQLSDWLLRRPDVDRVFMLPGGFGGQSSNTGIMFLTLKPKAERAKSQQQIQREVRDWTQDKAGWKVVVQDPSSQSFTGQRQGNQLEFILLGDDWDGLVATAKEVTAKMRTARHDVVGKDGVTTQEPVLADVDLDYRVGRPEIQVEVDRAAAQDLGIKVDQVASTLSYLIGGSRVVKFADDGRRLDVRVKALAQDRRNPADILGYRVRTGSGELVPLANLVTWKEVPTVQSLLRRDRSRAITIYGNFGPTANRQDADKVLNQLRKELPTGVRWLDSGQGKAMQDTFGSLGFAFILGLLAAYLVLGSQFNSFLHPITVMAVLPYALVGAGAALWLTGSGINLYSVIGILLLMGIAKKNSIILVDYANQAKARGLDAAAAMREAGPIRLRPILMTSLATLAAAVPTAIGIGEGGESRRPMAMAILGGVLVSTVLSLLVVPAFYIVADRFTAAWHRFFHWWHVGAAMALCVGLIRLKGTPPDWSTTAIIAVIAAPILLLLLYAILNRVFPQRQTAVAPQP